MANLEPLFAGIRKFEANNQPYKPKWDFKLRTWGYGTPVSRYAPPAYGSEGYNQAAELAMQDHATRSFNAVSKRFPNAPHGVKLALADLHYNTGGKFMHGSGLAEKLDKGDYEGAKATFKKYHNAGGKPYEGLIKRRNWGASDLWNEKYGDPGRYGEAGLTARIDPSTGVAAPVSNAPMSAPLPGSKTAATPVEGYGAVVAPHETALLDQNRPTTDGVQYRPAGSINGEVGQVRPAGTINGGYGINPLTGLQGPAQPGAPAIHMIGSGYGREQLPPEGSQVMPGPAAPTTGGWGASTQPEQNYLYGQTPWAQAMHEQMLTGDSSALDALNAAEPVQSGGLNSLFSGWF